MAGEPKGTRWRPNGVHRRGVQTGGSLPRAVVVLLAVSLLLCLGLLASEFYLLDGRLGFPLDDSWIHLAFAENLAAGHGLAVDPGELVAGSTGPLWTALAALGAELPGGDLLWMKLLGIGLHLGGVFLTWLLARALGLGRGLAALATGLTLCTGWLLWASLSGMEISLFVFLTLGGAVLHLAERARPERPPLSLAVLGLSVLARPEGALLVTCAFLDRFLRFHRGAGGALGWRPPHGAVALRAAAGLGLALLAFVPVAAFYLWIGDSALPTTLAVKTQGEPALHLPSLRYLHTAAGVLFRAQPWVTVLAPAGAVALVARLGTSKDRGLLPALWVAGLPLAYSCLGPAAGSPMVGNFGRYLFPLFPFLVVLGVLGLEPIERALVPRREPDRDPAEPPDAGWNLRRRLAVLAALVLLFGPTLRSLAGTATLYVRNVSDVDAGDVRMARWLEERLPEEAVLAVVDLGALSALLPNRVEDLAGIADPEVQEHIARARERGQSWQQGVLAFIEERRPDYLVVFPEWLTLVEAPGSPFRRLHTIHVPDNVTLGRDTIALYSTPWTRYPLRSAEESPTGEETR